MLKKAGLFLIFIFLAVPNFSFAAQPLSDGFDYSVGKPNAKGYYNAQDFGAYNPQFRKYHLGEDWNRGSKDNDAGDPVFAISNGVIRYSKDSGLVWGRVIVIEHQLSDGSKFYSQYGHLNNADAVGENIFVQRGQQIATIRHGVQTNFGYMSAHLHFELRTDSNPLKIDDGPGYSSTSKPAGWIDPSDFIDARRPMVPVTLNPPTNITETTLNLSWSKNADKNFKEYRIFRSTQSNSYQNPPITIITDQNQTIFSDTNLQAETSYFYKVTVASTSGLEAWSNEVTTTTEAGKQEPINISGDPLHHDQTPVVGNRFVTWFSQSNAAEPRFNEVRLYDLQTKELKTISQVNQPNVEPAIWDSQDTLRVVWFDFVPGKFNGLKLFQKNLKTGFEETKALPISGAVTPAIYGDNLTYAADKVKKDYSLGQDGFVEIYVYNLLTGTEIQIRHPQGSLRPNEQQRMADLRPKIWEDTVTWSEIYTTIPQGYQYTWGADVFSYNITTKQTQNVASFQRIGVSDVMLSGFNLMWAAYPEYNDGSKGPKSLFVVDYKNKTAKLTLGPDQISLLKDSRLLMYIWHSIAISDDYVVYFDQSDNLNLLNINTGEGKKLTNFPAKITPQRAFLNIYGQNIVWHEFDQSGKLEIYLLKIKL